MLLVPGWEPYTLAVATRMGMTGVKRAAACTCGSTAGARPGSTTSSPGSTSLAVRRSPRRRRGEVS